MIRRPNPLLRRCLLALLVLAQALLPVMVQAHGLARALPDSDWAQRVCGQPSADLIARIKAVAPPELAALYDDSAATRSSCPLCLLLQSAGAAAPVTTAMPAGVFVAQPLVTSPAAALPGHEFWPTIPARGPPSATLRTS